MKQTPEFLQGPIAIDYRELIDSSPALDAATKSKKPVTTGKNCSDAIRCPDKSRTTGKNCTDHNICRDKARTTGKNCSDPHICPKVKTTATIQQPVRGWSLPPAPPSA